MNCLIENEYIKGNFLLKKNTLVFPNELPNLKRIHKRELIENRKKKVGILYYGVGLLIFSGSWRTLLWGVY